ncbi:OmpA family protein [Cupriavidus numazuensis]|uniref:Peptidoglycan-associated lipoprotein n=1 Tax=Cupriavidus numazuensis TaxID=221992 RepID=A0ABM8TL43_9BURK|nr:OmpA family protein [Cupriavidus numazuensis]CAG2152933.1 Peptidoglycan-associated lipoprotein [Cupriavidus numazuensis]
MTRRTHGTFGVQRLLGVCLAGLSILIGVPVAQAEETILNEQNISEQSVTDALLSGGAGEGVVTRGIMSREAWEAQNSGRSAKKGAVALLITFHSNSAKLTENARTALDVVAHALQSTRLSDFKFQVEGHADPRGSARINQKLSEGRAAAVVTYLTQEGGVAAERLTPVGKGSSEPLNAQNPAAPENRRVTIVTVKN